MKNFIQIWKAKWFRKMSSKEYGSGLVSPRLLPKYKEHDFNLETRAIKTYFDMYALHISLFKCTLHLPLVYLDEGSNLIQEYVDFSEFIDNPEEGWKRLGSPYQQKEYHKSKCDEDELESFEEEWKEYWDDCGWSNTKENIKKWNEKLARIILLQEEFKELMRLVHKSKNRVKIIKSVFNYEDDIHAHASFGGRWRHDRKDRINKRRNYSFTKKG